MSKPRRVCCDRAECKKLRKTQTSNKWSKKNPDYQKVYMMYYEKKD